MSMFTICHVWLYIFLFLAVYLYVCMEKHHQHIDADDDYNDSVLITGAKIYVS